MKTRVSATNESGLFCREKLECLQISPCELKIARLLAWGYTQKEIACKLHKSFFTVQTQMKHIYAQLGIHKETDLTRWYLFKEYHINDDPFKQMLAVFLLLLSMTMLFNEQGTVRVFRSGPQRAACRVIPARARRCRNVFELQHALTA